MANQYLIHARLRKRWSEDTASEKVGISKKTYRRLEAGRVPSMNTLNLLCECFGEENPENLGYILERNHIRLKPPEEDRPTTEAVPEQPTDDLVQAHEDLLESIRRSLKRLAGTAESSQEASALDKLMTDVLSCLSPSLDIEAVGVGMWLCDRVDKLKRIGTCERITSQQYLVIVHLEIESWKSVIDEEYQTTEAYHYTRRTIIENLILFPATLLAAVQWSSRTDFVAKEFLIQCVPCIMACSHLLKGGGFATVEYMLPPYLRQLIKMAKSPSPLQKEAAFLAAQGCCLMGTIKHHRRLFREDLAYHRQAVELAKVTGDRLFVATTLTELGNPWFYLDRLDKYLEIYQEAECLIPKEPPFFPARLQICIYMGLSDAHASLGHTQDAEHYLALANAIQLLPDDDLFIPALDFDLSTKTVWEGNIEREIGEQEERNGSRTKAESWYKKANVSLGEKLPAGLATLLARAINEQALIALKLGNKEDFILYVKEGVLRAKATGSKKLEYGAKRNLQEGKQRWKHERDVLELDELFDSDENE